MGHIRTAENAADRGNPRAGRPSNGLARHAARAGHAVRGAATGKEFIVTRLTLLLLCAAAAPFACGPSTAPPPGRGQATRPAARAEQLAAEATVIFEGRVQSIRIVHGTRLPEGKGVVLDAPADTIVVMEPDVRWLVTVEVLKVRKGDAAAWSGRKRLAIHSPIRTFLDPANEAVGRTYTFYLR